jgi:hypothetical protein
MDLPSDHCDQSHDNETFQDQGDKYRFTEEHVNVKQEENHSQIEGKLPHCTHVQRQDWQSYASRQRKIKKVSEKVHYYGDEISSDMVKVSGKLATNPQLSSQDARVAAKREYNRLNAVRARIREKDRLQSLQKEYLELKTFISELQSQNQMLQTQLTLLLQARDASVESPVQVQVQGTRTTQEHQATAAVSGSAHCGVSSDRNEKKNVTESAKKTELATGCIPRSVETCQTTLQCPKSKPWMDASSPGATIISTNESDTIMKLIFSMLTSTFLQQQPMQQIPQIPQKQEPHERLHAILPSPHVSHGFANTLVDQIQAISQSLQEIQHQPETQRQLPSLPPTASQGHNLQQMQPNLVPAPQSTDLTSEAMIKMLGMMLKSVTQVSQSSTESQSFLGTTPKPLNR